MELQDYLKDVSRTERHDLHLKDDKSLELAFLQSTLGLISEIGEVQLEISSGDLNNANLRLEIGDIFFYLGVIINKSLNIKTDVVFKIPKQEMSSSVDVQLLEDMLLGHLYYQSSEMADALKKSLFHGDTLNVELFLRRTKVLFEYTCYFCGFLGIPVESILSENISKRSIRFPNGFCSEKSRKKDENREIDYVRENS